MKIKSSNPSFASAPYSISHKNVFDEDNRSRVAMQIEKVLFSQINKKKAKNMRCLDIGSSLGIITNYLANDFHEVIGADIDPNAIKIAKKTSKENTRFILLTNKVVPFQDNYFDVIICNEVYSYAQDPDFLFSEIRRILKPGGICYVSADNYLFPIESQYKLPLLHYLPESLAKKYVNLMGNKKYYLGKYKTIWGLKKMFNKFYVEDCTRKIIKNPGYYNFVRLKKYKPLVNNLPDFLLSFLYFFFPTYIFILKKTN